MPKLDKHEKKMMDTLTILLGLFRRRNNLLHPTRSYLQHEASACFLSIILLLLAMMPFTTTAFTHSSSLHGRPREPAISHKEHSIHRRIILRLGSDDVHLNTLSDLRHTSYGALLQRLSRDTQIVLVGEGTHGTEEFFRMRSEITQCLIQQHGFNVILCEGDAQPFFELNEFVMDGQAITDDTSVELLSKLFCNRFPDWMWSNMPMADLVTWLKMYNSNNIQGAASPSVQILGMDIQSPFDSIDFIIHQFTTLGEDELVSMIQDCYGPFYAYRDNIRKYGNDVYSNKVASQEGAVQKALDAILEYHRKQPEKNSSDIRSLKTWFQLIQSGHTIVASEAYYRQRIFPGPTTTWNLRTKAMLDAISRSMEYIDSLNRLTGVGVSNLQKKKALMAPRVIVYAHNSHVGDMSSTGYSSLGQVSLGQLCRETFGDESVFLIGMTTYEGTVRAACGDKQGACWKGNGEIMVLKKATDDSHESALHSIATSLKDIGDEDQTFGVDLKKMRLNECDDKEVVLNCKRPEIFVGSCYLHQTELMSHYTNCNLATQFDYIIHVDKSSAITV